MLMRYKVWSDRFRYGDLVCIEPSPEIFGLVNAVGKDFVEVLVGCKGIDDVALWPAVLYPQTLLRRYYK